MSRPRSERGLNQAISYDGSYSSSGRRHPRLSRTRRRRQSVTLRHGDLSTATLRPVLTGRRSGLSRLRGLFHGDHLHPEPGTQATPARRTRSERSHAVRSCRYQRNQGLTRDTRGRGLHGSVGNLTEYRLLPIFVRGVSRKALLSLAIARKRTLQPVQNVSVLRRSECRARLSQVGLRVDDFPRSVEASVSPAASRPHCRASQ